MTTIEDQIGQIKQIITAQPESIKGNIRHITRDFVESYVLQNTEK